MMRTLELQINQLPLKIILKSDGQQAMEAASKASAGEKKNRDFIWGLLKGPRESNG
jgi:hypothetical protein